jgi:hypothetical protein
MTARDWRLCAAATQLRSFPSAPPYNPLGYRPEFSDVFSPAIGLPVTMPLADIGVGT